MNPNNLKECKRCHRKIAQYDLCDDCYNAIKLSLEKRQTESKVDKLLDKVYDILDYIAQKAKGLFFIFGKALLVCVVIFGILFAINRYDSKQEEKYKINRKSVTQSHSTYQSSDYTSNSSYTPPKTADKPSDKIETAVNALMKSMEEQGYICSRSGYSFEQCVKAAKAYGIPFNQNASFMAMVTTEMYFLNGLTTDGRSFCAEIQHDKPNDNDWTVVNVMYTSF